MIEGSVSATTAWCSRFMTAALLLAMSAAGFAAPDDPPVGRYYDEAFSAWRERAIVLFRNDTGATTITVGQGREAVRGTLSASEKTEFVAALREALRLAEQARREGTESVRQLGDFFHGRGVDKYGIVLMFSSEREGQQSNVILYVKDRDNRLQTIELYLDVNQVARLIDRMTAPDDTPSR